MNPLVFKLIKIAIFVSAGYITARSSVNYFRKKNSNASMSDPEVIAMSVFCGALMSGFVTFVIKKFLI